MSTLTAPTSGHERLTDEQLRFYNTFGYLVRKAVFSPAEVETINRELEQTMEEQYSHQPFDGTKRHWTAMMDESTPFFASLLEDPRFLNPARQLYGDDVLGIITDANRYTGNTTWHPDSSTPLQYGVKFAFYLQPVTAQTGALRVIPATHHLFPFKPEFSSGVHSVPLEEVPCQSLDAQPGDVVAFDLRTWHASFGGSRDRRMCTTVYYGNPKNAEEEKFLAETGWGNVEVTWKSFGTSRHYVYSRAWMDNPGGSPTRQAWIERLQQIGYFDAPGSVEGTAVE